MKIKMVVIVCIAVLMTACGTLIKPELTKKKDPYSGQTNYHFSPIYTLSCEDLDGFPSSAIQVGFLAGGDLSTIYARYSGNQWVFIQPKAGMNILIDGRPSLLKGIDVDREVGGGLVTETAYYQLDLATLRELADSKKFQFRVNGSRGGIERCLGEEQLAYVGDYLSELEAQ